MASRSAALKTGNPGVVPNISNLGSLNSIGSSNFGTLTSVNIECDQLGRFLKCVGSVTLGTTVAGVATFTLPFSQSHSYTVAKVVGRWWTSKNTTTIRKTSDLWVSSGSPTLVSFGNDDYASAGYPDGGVNGTSVGNSGDLIYFEFTVPTIAYTAAANLSQGAGLATSVRPGLVSGNGGYPGNNTGAAIPAGMVGEVLKSSITTLTNVAATGTYGDAGVVTLVTPGRYRIDAKLYLFRNGATLAAGGAFISGVSTTSGNSGTGLGFPFNAIGGQYVILTANNQYCPPVSFVVDFDGTTITKVDDGVAFAAGAALRHKILADGFTAATPQYTSALTATRIA